MADKLANLKPFQPGQSGNPGGKPVNARNRLTTRFLTDLADDYESQGKAAIEACRLSKPDVYVKVLAALMPKQVEQTINLGDLDESVLAAAVALLQSELAAQTAESRTIEAFEPPQAH